MASVCLSRGQSMVQNGLYIIVLLALLGPCTGEEYEACITESITTGGAGSVGYITSRTSDVRNCKLHVMTCDVCNIHLEVVDVRMMPCSEVLPPLHAGCNSPCIDFISVHEPDYVDTTTAYISNTTAGHFNYSSLSRRIYMQFCLSATAKFRLKYTIKEKVDMYTGKNGGSGSLTSPDFPVGYKPSGDTYKYILNNTAKGYIRLEFPDWNLYNSSKLTIYHHSTESNQSLYRYGNGSRPFVKSQGSILIIVFETGTMYSANRNVRFLGFRARYSFHFFQDWLSKPFNYNCGEYYSLTWGGSFEFDHRVCPAGEIVDCVWVVTRYPRPEYSDYIWLRIYDISLDGSDELEVRSGNNSEGTLLKKLADITDTKSDIVEMDAVYIHLRAQCKVDRFFKVAFASYDNAQERIESDYITYYCPYRDHFACHNRRCISNSLKCDGVDHCKDWSDERNCVYNGPSCTSCQNGQGSYCPNEICDGTQNCLDGTDELNCRGTGSTSRPPVNRNQEHYYWGTITPVVLICLILGIITCIVISYYVRRKRLLRERNRCVNRSRPPGSRNAVIDSLGLDAGIYGMAPPTYDEALMAQYIPGQGTINTAFDGSLDPAQPPPPYTPKCVNNHLPTQYLPSYDASESQRPGYSGRVEAVSTSMVRPQPNSEATLAVSSTSQALTADVVGSPSTQQPPQRPPPLSMNPEAVHATLTGRKTSSSASQSSLDGSSGPHTPTSPTPGSFPERPALLPDARLGDRSSEESDNSCWRQNAETPPMRISPVDPPNDPHADPHSTSSSSNAASLQCTSDNSNPQCNTSAESSSQQCSQGGTIPNTGILGSPQDMGNPGSPHDMGNPGSPQAFLAGSTVIIEETGDVFV